MNKRIIQTYIAPTAFLRYKSADQSDTWRENDVMLVYSREVQWNQS